MGHWLALRGGLRAALWMVSWIVLGASLNGCLLVLTPCSVDADCPSGQCVEGFCGAPHDGGRPQVGDGGAIDAGALPDGGRADGGTPDGGLLDGGPVGDAGELDGGLGGGPDGGPVDGGPFDAGTPTCGDGAVVFPETCDPPGPGCDACRAQVILSYPFTLPGAYTVEGVDAVGERSGESDLVAEVGPLELEHSFGSEVLLSTGGISLSSGVDLALNSGRWQFAQALSGAAGSVLFVSEDAELHTGWGAAPSVEVDLDGVLRIDAGPSAAMGALHLGATGTLELAPGGQALVVDRFSAAGGSVVAAGPAATLSLATNAQLQALTVQGPLVLTADEEAALIVDQLELEAALTAAGQIELHLSGDPAASPEAALALTESAHVVVETALLDTATPVSASVGTQAHLELQQSAHLDLTGGQGTLSLSGGSLQLAPGRSVTLSGLNATGGSLHTASSQVVVQTLSSSAEVPAALGSWIIDNDGTIEVQGGEGAVAAVVIASDATLDFRAPAGVLRMGALTIDGRIESDTPANTFNVLAFGTAPTIGGSASSGLDSRTVLASMAPTGLDAEVFLDIPGVASTGAVADPWGAPGVLVIPEGTRIDWGGARPAIYLIGGVLEVRGQVSGGMHHAELADRELRVQAGDSRITSATQSVELSCDGDITLAEHGATLALDGPLVVPSGDNCRLELAVAGATPDLASSFAPVSMQIDGTLNVFINLAGTQGPFVVNDFLPIPAATSGTVNVFTSGTGAYQAALSVNLDGARDLVVVAD